MAERFVPLATLLRAPVAPQPRHAVEAEATPAAPSVAREIVDFAHADVVHDLALMRLAALEAFDAAAARLLELLANDVLARELALAPADLAALVARAAASFVDHEPVALAVAAVDRDRVHAVLPVRVDATLRAGDLVIYVRDGAFESSFALRLEDALARARARGVR